MIEVFWKETYEYYDFELLFLGHDKDNNLYICDVLQITPDGILSYIATPIDQTTLDKLKTEQLDLRSYFQSCTVFYIEENSLSDYTHHFEQSNLTQFPEEYLPEKNYFLKDMAM